MSAQSDGAAPADMDAVIRPAIERETVDHPSCVCQIICIHDWKCRQVPTSVSARKLPWNRNFTPLISELLCPWTNLSVHNGASLSQPPCFINCQTNCIFFSASSEFTDSICMYSTVEWILWSSTCFHYNLKISDNFKHDTVFSFECWRLIFSTEDVPWKWWTLMKLKIFSFWTRR